MAAQNSIQSFREFVQSLSSARYDEFRTRADAKVETADAFEQMRQHLRNLYQGVEVQHSFIESGGQIVDCIPVEQQPSLKNAGWQRIPTPPPLPQLLPESYETSPERALQSNKTAPEPGPQSKKAPPPQLHPDYRDRFGNQMWCPAGTIPMVRVTLEQISRFRNLQDFFQKAPRGGRLPNTGIDTKINLSTHRYAKAFQSVQNIGGRSNLNVWKPAIGPNQIFSLSQLWFIGGSGSAMQTAECGWQVYPQLYGTDHPCLFVYWTRDNYDSTGCYNLWCDGFVQTDGSSVIGGALASSQTGVDQQVEFQMGFFLAHDAWWFYLSGQPVGYYPVSIYDGGALASSAGLVECGGETMGNGTWPPMGSGAFAGNGFGVAAYQNNVVYSPVFGGLRLAHLAPHEPSPRCYTVGVENFSSTTWNTFFFFGGPGGTTC